MLTRREVFLGVLATTGCVAVPVWADSWMDLAVRSVSLSNETDRIMLPNSRRFFQKLRLTVAQNDIFLHSMSVHFLRGAPAEYRFDQLIEQGSRTWSIDLPGEARHMEYIDLSYRRRVGGGVAVVTLQGIPR